jgi:hypothetical protein
MANNPLGLQRSMDLQLDLDILFANLQYLRDSLPQTTTLGVDTIITTSPYQAIHNNLSLPIHSRVKFDALILVKSDPGIDVAISGPSFNYLRYEYSHLITTYVAYNNAATGLYGWYRISGVCEPSTPGILVVTANTSGVPVLISALSHLTLTLL